MLIYIKIAARNVHKNRKTVLLNGIGIALMAVLLIFTFSFSRGIETQIVQRNIEFETGGIMLRFDKEIAGWKNQPKGDSIYQSIQTVLETSPYIKGYRPRISTRNAALYGKENTKRISVEGIMLAEQPLLHEIISMTERTDDWKETPNGLIISSELAEESGLVISNECIIVLPSADGSVNMQEYIVTGIFQNTSLADKYQTYMLYEQAKELYHTNLPTRLLIDLADLAEAEQAAAQLKVAITSPDIEIKTHKDFMGRAQALSSINRNSFLGVTFFLLLISFVGISAMISEQVNERKKEMGTLLMFGFTRRSVKYIFLAESIYISLLFTATGVIIALTGISIVNYHQGIYLGKLASFAFGASNIAPEFKTVDLIVTSCTTLIYPLLATWIALQIINWKSAISLLTTD